MRVTPLGRIKTYLSRSGVVSPPWSSLGPETAGLRSGIRCSRMGQWLLKQRKILRPIVVDCAYEYAPEIPLARFVRFSLRKRLAGFFNDSSAAIVEPDNNLHLYVGTPRFSTVISSPFAGLDDS